MQLKETGYGEVTVWLDEIAVTLGATGKETGDNGKMELVFELATHQTLHKGFTNGPSATYYFDYTHIEFRPLQFYAWYVGTGELTSFRCA